MRRWVSFFPRQIRRSQLQALRNRLPQNPIDDKSNTTPAVGSAGLRSFQVERSTTAASKLLNNTRSESSTLLHPQPSHGHDIRPSSDNRSPHLALEKLHGTHGGGGLNRDLSDDRENAGDKTVEVASDAAVQAPPNDHAGRISNNVDRTTSATHRGGTVGHSRDNFFRQEKSLDDVDSQTREVVRQESANDGSGQRNSLEASMSGRKGTRQKAKLDAFVAALGDEFTTGDSSARVRGGPEEEREAMGVGETGETEEAPSPPDCRCVL